MPEKYKLFVDAVTAQVGPLSFLGLLVGDNFLNVFELTIVTLDPVSTSPRTCVCPCNINVR